MPNEIEFIHFLHESKPLRTDHRMTHHYIPELIVARKHTQLGFLWWVKFEF